MLLVMDASGLPAPWVLGFDPGLGSINVTIGEEMHLK
jgi:hypothetical protein